MVLHGSTVAAIRSRPLSDDGGASLGAAASLLWGEALGVTPGCWTGSPSADAPGAWRDLSVVLCDTRCGSGTTSTVWRPLGSDPDRAAGRRRRRRRIGPGGQRGPLDQPGSSAPRQRQLVGPRDSPRRPSAALIGGSGRRLADSSVFGAASSPGARTPLPSGRSSSSRSCSGHGSRSRRWSWMDGSPPPHDHAGRLGDGGVQRPGSRPVRDPCSGV